MLRRPMMFITSFYAVAILTSYYLSAITALFLSGGIALFLLPSKFSQNDKIIFLIMISMLAGTVSYVLNENRANVFQDDYDGQVTILCDISQVDVNKTIGFDGEEKSSIQLIAKARTIQNVDFSKLESISEIKQRSEKILIKYYEPVILGEDGEKIIPDHFFPGKRIIVTGNIDVPQIRSNPGCFNYSLYLRSVGIRHIITAEHIEQCEWYSSNKIQSYIYKEKETFLQKLEIAAGGDTASLIRAIMFGDKTSLNESILEEFQKNGTAHVLAVSGLHVGMIYGFLNVLWVWKKGKLFFLIIITFFLIYMAMASFSPSVVRAVIMVWLHIFAQLTNRRYDMSSAAYFTALLMLIHDPMHIFNVGFQMSFLAILTLSLLIPVIKHFYAGIFLAGMAIQAGLVPYTIYIFNYFSVAALFVNVPIIFLTGIIVPIGMCCMVAMFVYEPIGGFISQTLGGLCIIMEKLNSLTAIDGITVFDVRSPALWIVILYYLVLVVFISEDGRLLFLRKQKSRIKLLSCLVISVSLAFGTVAGSSFQQYDMVFVDVGQGDCLHFKTGKKGDYLVDGGGDISYNVGKKTLKPYLLKNGVKSVDGAFVTHLHTDHYKGIAELCREGMVKRLFLFEGYIARESEILEDTGLKKGQVTYLHAGQNIELSKDASVEIIWPESGSYSEYIEMAEDTEDENKLSLIMKINIKGKSVLMTGDVDSACLDNLAEMYGEALDINILKAAHHGSKYSDSEAFVDAVRPEYVVFQVGENNFGHPDKGVVENFRQRGIMICRNDKDGAVAFDFNKKGRIKVHTLKGE